MGTRHLIAAFIDGDYKIAQYGQWDGYPEGQGASVLEFISTVDKDAFKGKLRKCTFATQADFDKITNSDWHRTHPHLSRNAGSDVLNMVANSDDGLMLKDMRGFAGDSLFCEFAYVLDFDKGAFEVYRGFNKEPTAADSRFPSGAEWLEKTDGYEPVVLIQSYDFDCLPSKDGFLSDLRDDEDEEDAA